MSDNQKTFIIGLGHQKCGTSWVYEYLSQSALFNAGFTKEYHIWDALDEPLLSYQRDKTSSWPFHLKRKYRNRHLRYKMLNEPQFYFDYFASLLDAETPLTGDISPSYSVLKAERLQQIVDHFAQRDIASKAVILIREPLSRLKSAVRFNLDRQKYHEDLPEAERDFSVALEHYYTSQHCEIRTRYQNIITEARKVFSPDTLYIGFYESMFSPAEVARLSQFLGIETNSDFAAVKVNKTRNKVEETNIDRAIKARYKDVYDFCFDAFPQTRQLWKA